MTAFAILGLCLLGLAAVTVLVVSFVVLCIMAEGFNR